jgi:hypothetical protein
VRLPRVYDSRWDAGGRGSEGKGLEKESARRAEKEKGEMCTDVAARHVAALFFNRSSSLSIASFSPPLLLIPFVAFLDYLSGLLPGVDCVR